MLLVSPPEVECALSLAWGFANGLAGVCYEIRQEGNTCNQSTDSHLIWGVRPFAVLFGELRSQIFYSQQFPLSDASLRMPGDMYFLLNEVLLHQVVIALSGGEIIYFEMDLSGQLLETEKKDMTSEVSCLDIAPIPEGRQRTRFLAVGGYDATTRILSLDPGDCLNALSMQVVVLPWSVQIVLSGVNTLLLWCCWMLCYHNPFWCI